MHQGATIILPDIKQVPAEPTPAQFREMLKNKDEEHAQHRAIIQSQVDDLRAQLAESQRQLADAKAKAAQAQAQAAQAQAQVQPKAPAALSIPISLPVGNISRSPAASPRYGAH